VRIVVPVLRAARQRTWSKTFVEDLVSKCKDKTLAGEFGVTHVERVLESLQHIIQHIKGKRVLVIGSGEPPWLEACMLSLGCTSVTRIGFGKVKSEHPKLEVYSMPDAEALMAAGSLPLFDAAASYLTLQHEGFGRHGELLAPLADLQILARFTLLTLLTLLYSS
jgi:hypothetical protein